MHACIPSLILAATLVTASSPAATVELVGPQGSSYVIYHEQGAPSSVVMAMAELQQYVRAVSGTRLPTVT